MEFEFVVLWFIEYILIKFTFNNKTIEIRKMQSKKTKVKSLNFVPVLKASRCRFCLSSGEDTLHDLLSCHIEKKYLWSDVDQSCSCRLENFILSRTRIYLGGYPQFQKQYPISEYLSQYYTLHQTIQLITGVISNHAKTDVYKTIHFRGNLFKILRNNQRFANKKRQQQKPSSDLKTKSTEGGDIRGKTPKKTHDFFLKKHILNVDESLQQIKKLALNVNKMCYNFISKPLVSTLNKQFEKTLAKSKQKEKKKLQGLEKEITTNISYIKQSESTRVKKIKKEEDKNSLKKSMIGLHADLNSKSKKKGHKRMSSEHRDQATKLCIMHPLTPSPYSPPRQYFGVEEYTQKKSKLPYYEIREDKKRSKKSKRDKIKSNEKSTPKVSSNFKSSSRQTNR